MKAKKLAPQFRIEFVYLSKKWTMRIRRIRGGKVILSSGSQRYERRIDPLREWVKLETAIKAGRVTTKETA